MFSRLSEFPHPTAGLWAGRGPGPGRLGPAGRSCKDLRGCRGVEVGSGEALAQPNFFFPVHFSHFLPGRGRGPAGDGGGEGGDSGENSLARPGPLPAAHSRRPGKRWLVQSAAWGASGVSFPFLIPLDEEGWHLLYSCGLLSASRVSGSVRGPVYLHSNI